MKKFAAFLLVLSFMMSMVLTAHAEDYSWVCPNCGHLATGRSCYYCGNINTWMPAEEDTTPSEPEQDSAAQVNGIHSYEYCLDDCSWTSAFRKAIAKGGELVQINSRDEYNYILSEIERQNMNNIRFLIGGRRDLNSTQYFWVDRYNDTYGQVLNDPGCWTYSEWMAGEPSFMDGNTVEDVLSMFYYPKEGRWVLNDIPDDIIGVAPYYRGRVGYIIEYDNDSDDDAWEYDNTRDLYEEVIQEYREASVLYAACQDQDVIRSEYPNVNPTLIFHQYSYPNSTKLYYAYYDINSDGKEELLIAQGDTTALFVTYCDVFSSNGEAAVRFFDEDSLGDRSSLTIYTDGTIDFTGINGAYSGVEEYWVIGADGYSPDMVLSFDYQYDNNGNVSYYNAKGGMSPDSYVESLWAKTEIDIAEWIGI